MVEEKLQQQKELPIKQEELPVKKEEVPIQQEEVNVNEERGLSIQSGEGSRSGLHNRPEESGTDEELGLGRGYARIQDRGEPDSTRSDESGRIRLQRTKVLEQFTELEGRPILSNKGKQSSGVQGVEGERAVKSSVGQQSKLYADKGKELSEKEDKDTSIRRERRELELASNEVSGKTGDNGYAILKKYKGSLKEEHELKPSQRYYANIESIKLLKKAEKGEELTEDEREKLTYYTGWGGLRDYIQKNKKKIIELVGEEEYKNIEHEALSKIISKTMVDILK